MWTSIAWVSLLLAASVNAKCLAEQTSPSNGRAYISSNRVYFEEAYNTCKNSRGGNLVEVRTQQQLDEISAAINGQTIDGVWIGLQLDTSNLNCLRPQPFDPLCWVWEDSKTPVDTRFIQWDPSVPSHQTATSHGILKFYAYNNLVPGVVRLSFQENTSTAQWICDE